MKKGKILFVSILINLCLLSAISGCIEPRNGTPDTGTFSCNSQIIAEYHLIDGDCEDPASWVHIYDLGEVRRLVRITGIVEHKRVGATGEGPIRFFMSSEIPCTWGDIWWIRVTATYNRQISFDEYVDPDLPSNQEYKLWGRYLLIAGSTEDHQMFFSEGTAYFLELP